MRTKKIAILVFITLASAALLSVWQTLPPSPLPVNAPASEFSTERAMRHVQAIAGQPRFSGSSSYEAAADYILAELEDMGLETETQRVEEFRNTIGWIRGESSADIVLFTAHLDSLHSGPGATDDASGVAVLIVRVANSFVFKEPVFYYPRDFPFLWNEIPLPIEYGSI